MRFTFAIPSLTVLSVAALMLGGCEQQAGPAERAGRSIDNAGQNIKDAINPGPAQQAGRAIDHATGQ